MRLLSLLAVIACNDTSLMVLPVDPHSQVYYDSHDCDIALLGEVSMDTMTSIGQTPEQLVEAIDGLVLKGRATPANNDYPDLPGFETSITLSLSPTGGESWEESWGGLKPDRENAGQNCLTGTLLWIPVNFQLDFAIGGQVNAVGELMTMGPLEKTWLDYTEMGNWEDAPDSVRDPIATMACADGDPDFALYFGFDNRFVENDPGLDRPVGWIGMQGDPIAPVRCSSGVYDWTTDL